MNKILVVEDSIMNIGFLQSALSDQYKVLVAINGQVALDILDKIIPDVILLDVMMPVMDGYETYEHIVRNNQLEGIPVIFLTATENLDIDVERIDPGRFVKIIKKPFEMSTVQQIVEKALEVNVNG